MPRIREEGSAIVTMRMRPEVLEILETARERFGMGRSHLLRFGLALAVARLEQKRLLALVGEEKQEEAAGG